MMKLLSFRKITRCFITNRKNHAIIWKVKTINTDYVIMHDF